MKKIIILKGLPASGKSSWAIDKIKKHDTGTYKRINKDLLREMLDNSIWSKGNEKFVVEIRDYIILKSLDEGKHVIVDDTNLNDIHLKHIKELVNNRTDVKIEENFFDVSLNECIERDSKRCSKKKVGKKIIKDMYRKYLMPKDEDVKYMIQDMKLPRAIIVDLDGTLAIRKNRGPFEWNKVDQDDINIPVANLVKKYSGKILIMSGRDEICKDKCITWLNKNNIPFDNIFMRKNKDMRKDRIVKRELFENNIQNKYYIDYVLDDRNQVVDMWRNDLYLPCFQVASGDF